MADKKQMLNLLGQGLGSEQVAAAIGVTCSYVSQQLADPEFARQVTELRAQNLTAANDRDRKIDAIEDKIIQKLDDSVDTMYKPGDLLTAFRVVNAARRRGIPAQSSVNMNNTVVNLIMPTQLVRKFTKSAATGEVLEVQVDGKTQTLLTMPTGDLLRSLAARNPSDGNKYEQVRRYLPDETATATQIEGGK